MTIINSELVTKTCTLLDFQSTEGLGCCIHDEEVFQSISEPSYIAIPAFSVLILSSTQPHLSLPASGETITMPWSQLPAAQAYQDYIHRVRSTMNAQCDPL